LDENGGTGRREVLDVDCRNSRRRRRRRRRREGGWVVVGVD
jgi:hypothetical protein